MPVRVHYRKRPTFQEPEFPPGPSTRAFNEADSLEAVARRIAEENGGSFRYVSPDE